MNRVRWVGLAALAALAAAAAAYYLTRPATPAAEPARSAGAPAGGASAPPVSVTTVRVQKRDVPVELQATGTVSAQNIVELRPQVSGVVTQVHVREGQTVRAGQLLFTLDARSAEANLGQAQADLQRALATQAEAVRQLTRSRELLAQGFVAQGVVDTNQAQVDSQSATVAAARAAVDAARVTLGYSRITAPISGRTGVINPVAGSTVQAGSTALVTLTQFDPITVGFSLPQRHLQDALEALRSGAGVVNARLPEGGRALTGRLQFVDSLVDAASGTVRVKAQFANADQLLWPGAFVDVRTTVRTLKDALVVPQAAIIVGERGKTVYVVEAGNRAQPRRVEVVQAIGLEAVVTGLQPGDRVVVEGRQNVRPGSLVIERSGTPAAPGRRASAPTAANAASAPTAAYAASASEP